ncbi:MAG TPA: hypothetical protein VGZ50_01175 [Actinomycetota bacterium]|nr:hypothetical protein [Actinomycetota bacterium]
MKTTEVEPTAREPAPPMPGRSLSDAVRPWAASFLIVAVAGVTILGLFLWVYRARSVETPIGWDNVEYVWRTRLAQEVGIRNVPDAVPPRMVVKEGRPAYLVVSSSLSSLEGVEVLHLAVVLPAVMAAALGLAAAAFLRMAVRVPRWAVIPSAVAIGVSMNVVLMYEYGYLDNLMAAAVLMAATIAVVASVEERRGLPPAIVLLGAVGVIHGAFLAVVLASVVLTAAVYLPASYRQWRAGGQKLLDTPSARLGEVALGAGIVAGATLFATVSNPPSPRLNRGELAKKLREDIPRYRLPVLLPLAGVGAVALASADRARGGRTRFVLTFLLAWSGITLAGYIAYRFTSLPIPANRLLLFAFALPLLAVMAIFALGGILGRSSKRVTAAIVVAGIAGMVLLSEWEWAHTPSHVDAVKYREAAAADAYLRSIGTPIETPVVFIVDDQGSLPAATIPFMRDHILGAISTDRIARTFVYVGSPENYLAGQPTLSGQRQYDQVSTRFFSRMRHTYEQDPVVLIGSSFNVTHYHSWADPRPESVYRDQGISVVRGPLPSEPSIEPVDPVGNPGVFKIALLSTGTLALLAFIGLGWAIALLRRWLGRLEVLAVAPAVGVAALVFGGLIIDRVGIRLSGIAGALTPLLVAGAGWVLVWLLRRRGVSEEPSRSVS